MIVVLCLICRYLLLVADRKKKTEYGGDDVDESFECKHLMR